MIFAHRICDKTAQDVIFFNLNPTFCGCGSGAASSDPLRNLSRFHSHNQCHSFILRCDPHHPTTPPTHPRVIICRHFTTFLRFFSTENCRSQIVSTPIIVLPFILEPPLDFVRSRAHSEFGSLGDCFFMFSKSSRRRGTQQSYLGWKIKNLKIVFKKWSLSFFFSEPVS